MLRIKSYYFFANVQENSRTIYRSQLDAVTLEENYLRISIICYIHFLRRSKTIEERTVANFVTSSLRKRPQVSSLQ